MIGHCGNSRVVKSHRRGKALPETPLKGVPEFNCHQRIKPEITESPRRIKALWAGQPKDSCYETKKIIRHNLSASASGGANQKRLEVRLTFRFCGNVYPLTFRLGDQSPEWIILKRQ